MEPSTDKYHRNLVCKARLGGHCGPHTMLSPHLLGWEKAFLPKKGVFSPKKAFFCQKEFLPPNPGILAAKLWIFFCPKFGQNGGQKNGKAFFCQTFGQHWSASWSPSFFWPHSTPPFPPVFPFSPHFSIILPFFSPFFLLPPFFRPSFSPPPPLPPFFPLFSFPPFPPL